MKQVTTNMSFGQVFFVIGTILAFSAVGFYLGAKFGPRVLQWSEAQTASAAFLPDDQLMSEVKRKLAATNIDYNFFELVQSKKAQTVYALRDQKIPIVAVETSAPAPVAPVEEPLALTDDLLAAAKPDKPAVGVAETKKDEKTLKATEKPAEKAVEPVVVVKPAEKPATVKVAALAPEAKKPVAEKPLDNKTDATDPAKTAEIREEVTQTKYLLQVGSFESLKKAEKAKQVWAKRGYQAQIVVAQAGGQQWYRLRLGLYDDYGTIQNHQKNIRSKYNETAMILPIQ